MDGLSAQVSDQRMKSLQVNMETERASHLETKFNSEVLQVSTHTHTHTQKKVVEVIRGRKLR